MLSLFRASALKAEAPRSPSGVGRYGVLTETGHHLSEHHQPKIGDAEWRERGNALPGRRLLIDHHGGPCYSPGHRVASTGAGCVRSQTTSRLLASRSPARRERSERDLSTLWLEPDQSAPATHLTHETVHA